MVKVYPSPMRTLLLSKSLEDAEAEISSGQLVDEVQPGQYS